MEKVRFVKARVIEREPGVFIQQYQKREGSEWETIEREFDDHVLAVFDLMACGYLAETEMDLIEKTVMDVCTE